jgi:hypothetical protein
LYTTLALSQSQSQSPLLVCAQEKSNLACLHLEENPLLTHEGEQTMLKALLYNTSLVVLRLFLMNRGHREQVHRQLGINLFRKETHSRTTSRCSSEPDTEFGIYDILPIRKCEMIFKFLDDQKRHIISFHHGVPGNLCNSANNNVALATKVDHP